MMTDVLATAADATEDRPRHAIEALDDLPILIPVPCAAKLLGISRSAAYRFAASGELPTAHLGGRVYVVTQKLQQFLESA